MSASALPCTSPQDEQKYPLGSGCATRVRAEKVDLQLGVGLPYQIGWLLSLKETCTFSVKL